MRKIFSLLIILLCGAFANHAQEVNTLSGVFPKGEYVIKSLETSTSSPSSGSGSGTGPGTVIVTSIKTKSAIQESLALLKYIGIIYPGSSSNPNDFLLTLKTYNGKMACIENTEAQHTRVKKLTFSPCYSDSMNEAQLTVEYESKTVIISKGDLKAAVLPAAGVQVLSKNFTFKAADLPKTQVTYVSKIDIITPYSTATSTTSVATLSPHIYFTIKIKDNISAWQNWYNNRVPKKGSLALSTSSAVKFMDLQFPELLITSFNVSTTSSGSVATIDLESPSASIYVY